jgi:ATP adenylyltransferase
MPHRMAYIKGENRVVGTGPEGCPFCQIPRLDDAEGLIVARGTLVFTVLNLYPYNAGHLMVCPYRHVADYTELDEPETAELAEHTKLAMTALRAASGAQGFNIGMNMGNVAGAGISAHLHQHVVPRWGGDTNFLPVISATKVLPQLLSETREMVAAAWPGRPAEPALSQGGHLGAVRSLRRALTFPSRRSLPSRPGARAAAHSAGRTG